MALELLYKRRGVLGHAVVTGGEPLLWGNRLFSFLREARALGYRMKLDTNGSLPDHLSALLELGIIDYIALDIKNLPGLYAKSIGLPVYSPDPVFTSVRIIKESGIDHQFRCTQVPGLVNRTDMETWAAENQLPLVYQEFRETQTA